MAGRLDTLMSFNGEIFELTLCAYENFSTLNINCHLTF